MFLKIILIIVVIGIMVKIFNLIKNTINFFEKFLNKFEDLQKEHKDIYSYLKDTNKEISSMLSEDGHIRKDINYIKNSIKEEQYKKECLSQKELDINKTIQHINTFNKNYTDLKLELQELKIENKLLNKKIEDLQEENTQLKNKDLSIRQNNNNRKH